MRRWVGKKGVEIYYVEKEADSTLKCNFCERI